MSRNLFVEDVGERPEARTDRSEIDDRRSILGGYLGSRFISVTCGVTFEMKQTFER